MLLDARARRFSVQRRGRCLKVPSFACAAGERPLYELSCIIISNEIEMPFSPRISSRNSLTHLDFTVVIASRGFGQSLLTNGIYLRAVS